MARSSKKKTARRPLSRERIELAALALVERRGVSELTIRRLAASLRCEAMSIYYYFPSKAHLMDALADRIIGEMPPLPTAELPWTERLAALGRQWRAVLTKRPGLFVFMATHRLNTPTCLAWLDKVIALFGEGPLPHDEAIRLFRAFGYYLMGACLDETVGYARGPSTVEPVPGEVMKRDFPHVVAAGPFFSAAHFDATFEFGMRLFLDSVAAEARRRAAGPGGV